MSASFASVESARDIVVETHTRMEPQCCERIHAFLRQQPGNRLAFDPVWMSILKRGLRHRPLYLEAMRDRQTVGVLPLASVQSMLFGRYLVSLPYLNYGGILASDELAAKELLHRAVKLAESQDVRFLELRHLDRFENCALNQERSSKVVMWRDLPSSPEEMWKQFKPEVRNQIRKGEKSGLTVHWGDFDLLDEFYNVFAINMRDLGTPVYGKRLFSAILEELGSQAEICVLRLGDKPVAAALLLHDDVFTEVPSASSLRAYNKTCANMLMYHRLMVRAIERGQKIFDFGRSTLDGGTFKFKRQWGAEPRECVWQYHLRHGSVENVRPDNDRYKRKIETWKKLPVWFTRLVGPSIVRGVP